MYIKLKDGMPEQYSIPKLRKDNPNTSFPKEVSDEVLAVWGVYPYTQNARPKYNPKTQICSDGDFELVDGEWCLGWVVNDRRAEDVAQFVRSMRDGLLRDCDWVFVRSFETGVATPDRFQVYRQALRDITAQEGFPFSVDWPVKPE